MKTTELRIGNYLFSNLCEPEVLEVTLIDGLEGTIKTNGLYVSNINNVLPISISHKWMKNFGFKYDADQDEYSILIDKWNKLNICNDFSYGLESIGSDYNPEGEFLVFQNDIIKYVHQLQNLYFYLTNGKKELIYKK